MLDADRWLRRAKSAVIDVDDYLYDALRKMRYIWWFSLMLHFSLVLLLSMSFLIVDKLPTRSSFLALSRATPSIVFLIFGRRFGSYCWIIRLYTFFTVAALARAASAPQEVIWRRRLPGDAGSSVSHTLSFYHVECSCFPRRLWKFADAPAWVTARCLSRPILLVICFSEYEATARAAVMLAAFIFDDLQRQPLLRLKP